jgi:hypothetical protein
MSDRNFETTNGIDSMTSLLQELNGWMSLQMRMAAKAVHGIDP